MKKQWIFFSFFFCFAVSFDASATPGYHLPWGKRSELQKEKEPPSSYPAPSVATLVARQVILFHQKVISPIDGPRSHFRPCSSQYMKIAMMKHGFCKGFIMGCDRLLRENKDPWLYRNVVIDGKLIKYDPPH
jgi:putative component of membrane protein insertase Oxa1/YidC/SpoIIIJ protein YidD